MDKPLKKKGRWQGENELCIKAADRSKDSMHLNDCFLRLLMFFKNQRPCLLRNGFISHIIFCKFSNAP